MKKISTFICISFLSHLLNAQTLTVREAFDFSIGDTIVTERSSLDSFKFTIRIFDTVTFAQKWFSEKKDTLFYQQKKDVKTAYRWGNVFKSYFDTLSLSKLDSPAYVMNLKYISGLPYSETKDRIFNQQDSFNNRRILSRKSEPVSVDGGFLAHYDYAAGLGRTYLFETPSSKFGMPFYKERILYYRKGNENWKVVTKNHDIFFNKIKIYPNPISNYIYIDSEENIKKVEIINLSGQVVFKEANKNQINLSIVPNGTYFLWAYDEKTLIGIQKIVINH